MDLAHNARHTRRGFLRGDSAPKFFKIADEISVVAIGPERRPPGTDGKPLALEKDFVSSFPPPYVATASNGAAFFSWLADQLTGQASQVGGLTHRLKVSSVRIPNTGRQSEPQASEEEEWLDDCFTPALSDGIEYGASTSGVMVLGAAQKMASLAGCSAGKSHQPVVEIINDGARQEIYAAGAALVKDVLGRVSEVSSQYGERLHFRYCANGQLEFFERRGRDGQLDSRGRFDKSGVVVLDREGRVRAAGESMTVDSRGRLYLHGLNGQFFCLDLIAGIHCERRRLIEQGAYVRYVTSLFTHDGFRMATMFSVPYDASGALVEINQRVPNLRFYGRDGTMVEFAGEDELRQLYPLKVSLPAHPGAKQSRQSRWQARTAWDSVHEYLMRVS